MNRQAQEASCLLNCGWIWKVNPGGYGVSTSYCTHLKMHIVSIPSSSRTTLSWPFLFLNPSVWIWYSSLDLAHQEVFHEFDRNIQNRDGCWLWSLLLICSWWSPFSVSVPCCLRGTTLARFPSCQQTPHKSAIFHHFQDRCSIFNDSFSFKFFSSL